MSFSRLAAGITLLLLTSACQLRFHATAPPRDEVKLASGDAGCLNGGSLVLTDLFEGRGDPARVNALFHCASHSLELFEARVRGAEGGVYRPEELRRFIERYFLTELRIPDGLLAQGMALKRTLIGGDRAAITHAELARARELIESARVELLRLRPHFPLTWEKLSTGSEAEVEGALRDLEVSARNLAEEVQKSGATYAFADLTALLTELEDFVVSVPARHSFAELRGRLPVLGLVKEAFLPPSAESILASQWRTLFVEGSQAFTLAVRFERLRRSGIRLGAGTGRIRLRDLARQATDFGERALARRPQQTLGFHEMETLLDAVLDRAREERGEDPLPPIQTENEAEVPLFGKKVRRATIKASLPPLFRGVLGGVEADDQGRLAQGFSLGALGRMRAAFEHWSAGQDYLERMFRLASARGYEGMADPDHRSIADPLTWLDLSPGIGPGQIGGMGLGEIFEGAIFDPFLREAGMRLRELAIDEGVRPIFSRQEGEISFEPSLIRDRRHSFHSLSSLNWMSEVTRVLMDGYIAEPARRPRSLTDRFRDGQAVGVSAEEIARFYQEFRQLGIEVKQFSPTDTEVPYRRVRDANIFLYGSDGSPLLTPVEGMQLLGYLISAAHTAVRVHERIGVECPAGPLDIYDYPTFAPDCYRRAYFAHYRELWRGYPGLIRYYEGLGAAGQADFAYLLEDVSREHGYTQAVMGSDDTQRITALLQDVETLFARFDVDGDGILSRSEATGAFELVKGPLETASCLHSRAKLEVLFSYLLKFGRPPTDGLGGKLSFLWWWGTRKFRGAEADRMRILMIFSGLSNAIDTAKSCGIERNYF